DAGRAMHDMRGVVARLVAAAGDEVSLSVNLPGDGLKERIVWRLERIEAAAARTISRGTGVLATIGATAPFIGLFGTVWGIMNSFIGISKAHTTNLAVVAPGIAEALLATAFGLAAAIPAVVIYNVFARSIGAYRATLADASAEVMRLVSRDLDRDKTQEFPLAASAQGDAPGPCRRGPRGRPRDQRPAFHRRDAGAADHLHGGGAAGDRRHRGRPPVLFGRTAAQAGQAGLSYGQARPVARGRRRP